MCGRFANHVQDMREWAGLLGDWPSGAARGYNIAPTQTVAAGRGHGLEAMRWGLVPHWSDKPTTRYATFNARIESVAGKPAFRHAWRARQRCVVPALGYYEWRSEKGRKQPYFVHRTSGAPLMFGGIWECWQSDDEALLSFSILTQPAAPRIAWLHERMPLLVDASAAVEWFTGTDDPLPAVAGATPDDLDCYAVSTEVNNARHQGAALVEPLDGTDESG